MLDLAVVYTMQVRVVYGLKWVYIADKDTNNQQTKVKWSDRVKSFGLGNFNPAPALG